MYNIFVLAVKQLKREGKSKLLVPDMIDRAVIIRKWLDRQERSQAIHRARVRNLGK